MSTHSSSQPHKKPAPVVPSSPKASTAVAGGQCLCSPTKHQGSFRCRYHRSMSSTWLQRSNSMPSAASKSHPGGGDAAGAKPIEAPGSR